MATVASLVINLTASTSQLEKGFLQATRLTDRFVKSTKSVTRQLDEIARYGRNAGLALTAMSLSVRKLVKASADHEESMLRVKAVARATVQEYHALSAAALQASTTTRHSLSSIGEGMKFLAMAGFQAKEITEMIPVVTRMATAGAVDMVTAADITTNILAGYGMAVEDLSKATDVLVAAFTGANVNLQLLGETFKHVGPVAKSAGMEFEEIAAAAALLGNAGIQGSIAGTSLKSAISRLVSPSNTAARILKRLGVETTTSEGKLRNLADIIDDLSKAGATTADVLRIFGLRAGPSMARLLDVGADALRQYTQRLRDSEGWAELIEAEQMQSFNAQLDLTKNIIHAFSVELGDVLLPYMKTLNWLIGDLVDGWRNLDDATKDNVIRIAVVGGAILSFITVLGLVAGAISMVIKGFTTLGIILGLVTSGPVLAILGIALAIGYLKKAWDENLGGIQDKTKTVLDTIKGYWARFMTWWEGTPAVTPEGLTSGFDSDQPGFKYKLLAMKQFLAEKWEWVIDIGGEAWKWITETTLEEKLEDTKRWLKEGWEWVIDLGGEAWDWFLNDTKLGNALQRAWGRIEQWWEGTPAVTPEGLTSGFDSDQPGFKYKLLAMKQFLAEKWEWVIDIGGEAWKWITETTLEEKLEDTKRWLKEGWEWVIDLGGEAWDWFLNDTKLGNALQRAWGRIEQWWEGTPAVTPEGLTSGFDSDQPGFKYKLLAMKQFLAEKWEWVIDIGGEAWKWITETTLEEKLEDTKRWLKEGWEWVIDLGGEAWDWFLDDTKLGNTIKRAWGWIEQWWHGVPAVTPEGLTSGYDYDQPGFKHKLMGIKYTFTRIWSEIQSKITALREQFQEKWEWIVYLAGDAWPWLTETTWAEKWEDIKGWLTSGWDWSVNIVGSAWSWLTETTWAEKVEDVKGWLTSGWDWLVDIAGSAWSWLTETTWAEKVEDVKGWLSEAWDWTMNLAGNAWAWIEENLPWLADTLTAVKSLIAENWEWVVDTAGSAWDWFSNSEAVNELIGRLDALKARITDSEAWKWTVDVGLPAVLEAGEMVIKVVVELGGETYDAIKTGFETGDWGPLFGIASDLWSKGALIWLGFEIADTTFEIVKKKIIKGLGLSGVTGGLVGTGLVIGVATIGIQLAEAWAKGDYENFMRNIVAASIAAVFGGTIGGPAGAIVTFDIVLNLKLGEKIEGWTEAWYELLGVPPEHEKLLKEYEQYRQALIDEATKDMNWLQKLWWQLTGNQPEGLLSFPEWKQARGLDSLEVEVEPIPVGYVDDFKGLIRQIASSPEFDDLRAKLSEWNIVLEDFLVKLAQSESGLKDIVNWAGARGEFQMMPESMKAVEEALGTSLNWDDATERAFGSIVWFRMGVESEFDTIVAAAERLGVTLEEALKLWWVAGGGNLSKLYNLDAVAWTEPSGRKVTYRDILNAWRGYSEGTPWTGWGALDEPAGIVHKREAVIPWKVLRKGPLSVLEFLGMRGFQEGRVPSMPGVSQARETLSWMQDIFNDIADVLLAGLATLFEYIIRAVEVIAVALVGEEKAEEIKAKFQSFYDGITDLIQKMKVTTPPEPEEKAEEKVAIKGWQEWLAGLEAAMEEFDWTSPINTFVNTLANGLAQAESYMAQFAGEIVRLIRFVVQKTEDGTRQIVFDFDYMIAQMANSLATMIAESLVSFLSGYDVPQQRKDPFPNLTELLDNLENYEKNQKRLKQLKATPDLATIGGGAAGAGIGFAVGGPVGALIGGFLGALVGRKGAQAATEREIEELTEKLKTDFLAIKEMLGTTMQDVANGLARAFSAETYEDFVDQFAQNLENQVKNALITAFMASDVVRPLIEELSNQISLAVTDAMLDANERASILGLYDQIVSVSGDFYKSLQNLGIATKKTAKKMEQLNDVLRNVPQGLKIVSNRLAAAGYSVPGLHTLAYEEPNDRVTEQKVEVHIHGSIYGVDELKRVIKTTVAEAQRRVSLATNGVG